MGCKHSAPVSETESNSKEYGPIRDIVGGDAASKSYPLVGPEAIMKKKTHGTYIKPVQSKLRYGCDFKTADNICNHNRHLAEHFGYFTSGPRRRAFNKAVKEAKAKNKSITFFDSNTGLPLFTAPRGRSWDSFLNESSKHGWPSFRDAEVNWENVRCLRKGEAVSIHGTHLGHNLPDSSGNRYCINLVSIAGNPDGIDDTKEIMLYTDSAN
ncbi:expressed unknown protein [Seminavis robusta]|uniref:Uncharacterized protein n=1 Tax=Seminavis robusta TaxID=568900 RepID=A0A9N8E457_9STRA|nr:expressed unknown protein [Seminavis robusta]|eukprot:Sro644_g180550.1 n/a (211) ;mRNA; r:51146-51951